MKIIRLNTSGPPINRGGTVVAALFLVVLAQHRVVGGFCGVDEDGAKSECWQPCSNDGDCCATSQRCYDTGSDCGSEELTGENHFYCGTSWCDAAYTCGTPCPEQTECPEGQGCYSDIPCDSDSPTPAPPLPAPPTSAPYQFCGSSMADAETDCWQPCPRGDSDCCSGLKCFDTSNGSEGGGTGSCSASDYSGSNHFFCGTSWCDAAYSCTDACPDGTTDECPSGQNCYADIPCLAGSVPPEVEPPAPIFNKYCGTTEENAAENCWQPCRDNDDCCTEQTCYEGVTSCPYADNIGADHYFCGADYCSTISECPQPCPSGFDAECDSGTRCFPNVPCNANVRSMSANMLKFGLPVEVNNLFRSYKPGEIQKQPDSKEQSDNNATTPSSPGSATLIVSLFFAVFVILVLGVGYKLSKRRRENST